MMLRSLKRFALLLLASLVASNIFGTSVTLTPSGDTTLDQAGNGGNDNFGGGTDVHSGTNGNLTHSHGVLRFNLAGQIPSNAAIQSVTLTLIVTGVPGSSPHDSTFDLHRLLVDWGEGAGDRFGRAALNGEATWNNRFHPSTGWSAPGATAPGDYLSAVSSSKFVQGLGSYTFSSTPDMISDVSQWLANPGMNHGWIVISEDEISSRTMRRFGARESASPATLTVQYVIVVTPVIKSIGFVSGTIQFNFLAAAQQAYIAEYRDSLTYGGWLTLANINPQPSPTDVIVTDPAPPGSQRFYRVRATF
jgi:hypothetical protein